MQYFLLLLIFICGISEIHAQIYYEGNGHQLDCDTTLDKEGLSEIVYLQYDSKTTVTMYGDSRSDFADLPPYNYSNMNALVGADIVNWNVQNFGVAGWTSSDLLGHLLECLKVDPLSGNPLKSNYIIASKVALEIGGNDIYHVSPLLYVMPWIFPATVERTRSNIERILGIFQRRNKQILLIGNYPAGGVISRGKDFSEPFRTPLLSLGFAVSVGLASLEVGLVDLSRRYQIEYHRVWDDFAIFPGAPFPRADLTFLDLIHPSPEGFRIWGNSVGNKFRSLGWDIVESVPEAPTPGITDPPPPPPGWDPILVCFLLKICH